MLKTIKKPVDKLLEIGKTYKLAFQTGGEFVLQSDPYKRDSKTGLIDGVNHTVWGEYVDRKYLGKVPIGLDRLIPEQELKDVEISVCDFCGEQCKKCKKK